MRDPKRIVYLMDLLTKIWEKQPDTRFNQLIHNLQWEYSVKNNYKDELWKKEEWMGIVSYHKTYNVDLFNVEDDSFIGFLENKLSEC